MLKENMTRILGIILLVISMLTHKYFGASVVFIVLAGLVMLIYSKKFAQQQFKIFIQSFKQINKKYFLIALYDLIFIAMFFLVIPLFSQLFMSKIQNITTVESAASLLIMLLAYLVTVTIILLLTYSISRGLIWTTILKKKFTGSFIKRFLLLNFLWWLILAIPTLIVLGAKVEYLFSFIAIVAIVYIHLTSIIHYDFTKNRKIGKAIKQAFALTFKNIKHLLLPYAYIALVYFIILQVFWIIPQTEKIMLFASILFVLFYLAWYRLYIAQVFRRLQQ